MLNIEVLVVAAVVLRRMLHPQQHQIPGNHRAIAKAALSNC